MQLLVNGTQTTTDLIDQLRATPREKKDRDFKEELLALLEVMQKQKITGNEFFLLFVNLRRYNFLGTKFECALLGEKNTGEKTGYKRKICLRVIDENVGESEKDTIYVIDPNYLSLSQCTLKEIVEKVENEEYVWENPDYEIGGKV